MGDGKAEQSRAEVRMRRVLEAFGISGDKVAVATRVSDAPGAKGLVVGGRCVACRGEVWREAPVSLPGFLGEVSDADVPVVCRSCMEAKWQEVNGAESGKQG